VCPVFPTHPPSAVCSASSRLPSRSSQPGNVRAPLTLSVAIFLLDALLQRILPPITAPVPSGSVEADEQETPGVNEQWEETVVLLPSSSSSQSAAPSGGVARQTQKQGKAACKAGKIN
jgi:hypothetical protein